MINPRLKLDGLSNLLKPFFFLDIKAQLKYLLILAFV